MNCFRWRWTAPVLVLLVGIGDLTGSWSHADPISSTIPPVRNIQYRGTHRIGTMVVVIIGFIVVPTGLIAFLYLAIIHCVKNIQASNSKSDGSRSASSKDVDSGRRNRGYIKTVSDDVEMPDEDSTFCINMHVHPIETTTYNPKEESELEVTCSQV